MFWVILISFLLIIFYLYKTSKNDFFFQSPEDLAIARNKVIQTLQNLERSQEYIKGALEDYDWFCDNPERYDGSTIVEDLCDVYHKGKGLETASLRHDKKWIFGANRNFLKCWKSNWEYYKDLKANGKSRWKGIFRMVGLNIISIVFVPVMYIKYNLK